MPELVAVIFPQNIKFIAEFLIEKKYISFFGYNDYHDSNTYKVEVCFSEFSRCLYEIFDGKIKGKFDYGILKLEFKFF